MVEIRPLSVFYRAYFGTMKFKERLAFCFCVVCLVIPFIWLRWRVSDDKHPLMLSVIDTQSLMDGMDFNRIDHAHRHQRSTDQKFATSWEKTDSKNSNFKTEVNKEPSLNKRLVVDNVDTKKENKQKKAIDDVDYEYDDPWTLWKEMVKSRQITSLGSDDSMNMILEAMMYKPIVAVGVGYRGTQLKATFILEGKQRVVFKPMR